MENQNLAATLKHREKSYSLQELKNTIKPHPIEKKIIDCRCKGLSFCQLAKDELVYAIDQIMLRGAAISGCALPQTEFFAGFISSELSIFINKFGYGELTLEEILLAMRLNSKGLWYPSGLEIDPIQFTGVCFNVNYIAKVLANYMIMRNQLDRVFQNQIDGY